MFCVLSNLQYSCLKTYLIWHLVFSIKQDEVVPRKEKRQYKRRKHKTGVGAVGIGSHGHGHHHSGCGSTGSGTELLGYNCSAGGELLSSEDEGDVVLSGQSPQSEDEEPDPSEGPFTFKRKKYCNYHAVSCDSYVDGLGCSTKHYVPSKQWYLLTSPHSPTTLENQHPHLHSLKNLKTPPFRC